MEKLFFLFLVICSFTEGYNTYIVNLVDSYRFQKEELQPRFGSRCLLNPASEYKNPFSKPDELDKQLISEAEYLDQDPLR